MAAAPLLGADPGLPPAVPVPVAPHGRGDRAAVCGAIEREHPHLVADQLRVVHRPRLGQVLLELVLPGGDAPAVDLAGIRGVLAGHETGVGVLGGERRGRRGDQAGDRGEHRDEDEVGE
jgi:hypothetical protein